jgi:DNA-binding transcriptional regulator GbsR (MarR family)
MSEKSLGCNIELFESFSVHLEKSYNFPPLAAKVLAYMVLQSDKEGYTFEELLQVFKVSKSSLSTSINLLLSKNEIEYIHKIDSRKRYFRLNYNYVPEKLEFLHGMIAKDLFFTTKINAHRSEMQFRANIDDNGIINAYIDYLEKSKELLEQTINQINKIQLENK